MRPLHTRSGRWRSTNNCCIERSTRRIRSAAVVSELENRIADLSRSHQQLAAVDKNVGHLEQRAAAAVTAVKLATGAKNAFQHEAKRRRLYRASYAYTADPSIAQHLGRRASRAWRSLTPDRLVAGGVAVALSVVVVVLVGIAWRFSRTENGRTENPPPPLLASRRLEFTPIDAVALLTPAPVAHVVASRTAVGTSGNGTARVREQSVGTAGNLPQFIGTLVIESEPAGATAFVNQQPVGVTPVLLKGLRAGSHVVRVEYEGYERWSTAVTVSTIHEARVTARLQRASSR